ncbi:unnamed protein product [Tuber melanosporum]|uniref:(Perigord truffle) hypothetical protein n=1 Tax=Tuber melanosporum (strain Mel28) TaxID=656061 RepID=D5GEW5_TUBMM|nr:uncharacterized protein GSTUM_00006618001 [Tuber melanosporum]CAZ83058.1 unnamed protein product [Tuber melanosporum]
MLYLTWNSVERYWWSARGYCDGAQRTPAEHSGYGIASWLPEISRLCRDCRHMTGGGRAGSRGANQGS